VIADGDLQFEETQCPDHSSEMTNQDRSLRLKQNVARSNASIGSMNADNFERKETAYTDSAEVVYPRRRSALTDNQQRPNEAPVNTKREAPSATPLHPGAQPHPQHRGEDEQDDPGSEKSESQRIVHGRTQRP
jgi:hypothetical protein